MTRCKTYLAVFLFAAQIIPQLLSANATNTTLDSLFLEFEKAGLANNLEDIKRIGTEAKAALPQTTDINDYLKAQLIIAQRHIYLSELSEAEELVNRCFKRWKQNTDKVQTDLVPYLYAKKALLLRFQSKPNLEEKYLDSTIQILHKIPNPNPTELANAFQKLCYIYYNRGQIMESVDYMLQAENALSKNPNLSKIDSMQLANIYNDIAFLSGRTSDYNDIIPYYRLALKYYPKSYNIKLNMINNLRYEGDHKTAYNLAKEVLGEVNDNQVELKAKAYIALIAIIATSENYISKHPEEEIKNYFQKILDLQDELTLVNYPYAAAAAGTMCDYYRRVSKKKDLDLAQLYLNKQEELINKKVLYSTASNSSMIRYYHSRKAQFAWLNENYNEATLFFDKIWDSYSPNRSEQMEELINALYQNFHILDHLTDYIKMHTQNAFKNPDAYKYNIDRANSIYQQTDIILDSLFLKGKTKIDNDKIEEFYELGYGMSLIQHYKTGSKKYANTAYEQFEKLMNIEAFNHHLQSKLKHSNSDYAEIIQSKNQVREQIDILESSMDGSPAEKVKLDSLDRLFFSLSKQLNDSPNIFRNEKNKGASLDQIQARLGSTDLHFHLAFENISQQLYILVVSRDNVYSKIQIAPNLRYKLDLLLNKLSDPDSTGYESLLQELHQLVIEPFEEYVKGKKLTFTTTNDLSRLPFDLLMNKKNDYLCFTNPTIHSFTQFKNWEETKSEVTRFKTHLLALTNSFTDSQTGEEGFPSQLIFAEKEIEILKDRYDAKLIKSHQHAKKKFIDACQNTGIIHLALHSEVQALNPIKSRLLLSKTGNPDQDLYYHEIDDLKLSSDLVILSSCQSGLGYSKSAGSVSSLARAFQFAGAKNLVHTLWSINDESSAQFMDIFYTQLESKENLSTCLSESKKKFYEEAPLKWKHPYYWAAFVLNGEDGPVEVFPQRIFTQGFVGKYWIMTCSFMIGLILLILLYYYSKKSRLAG